MGETNLLMFFMFLTIQNSLEDSYFSKKIVEKLIIQTDGGTPRGKFCLNNKQQKIDPFPKWLNQKVRLCLVYKTYTNFCRVGYENQHTIGQWTKSNKTEEQEQENVKVTAPLLIYHISI